MLNGRLIARYRRGAGVLATGVLAAMPAFAQVDSGGEEAIEMIVVTGTRIQNQNEASSSPVTTYTGEEISIAGTAVGIENILNELPQFTPGEGSTTSVTSDAHIVSAADLRGLGPQRTLVLVNGTRWVPATTDGIVDLNTVPTGLIERVDVVTGGASAVYGSDAIAGVVNFILKDNFEGLELRASINSTEKGDALTRDLGLTTGTNFASGRGNVVADIAYSRRDELLAGKRSYATDQLNDSTCEPGSLDSRGAGVQSSAPDAVPCFVLSGSGTLPGGTINNSIVFDQDGNPTTPRPPGLFDNFFPYNYIQLPLERWTATALASFGLSDSLELYSRFVYANTESARNQRATSTSVAQAPLFGINLDNPYVTPALRDLLEPLADEDGIAYVNLTRRFTETGDRTAELRQQAFQAQVGLRGDLAENWSFDIYHQYGKSERADRFGNDIAISKLEQALLAVAGPDGRPVCIDPSRGCVPANIFGEGNVSPEAADFLRTTAFRDVDAEEIVTGAYLSGDSSSLFELPAGPVAIVFGAERRDVEAKQIPDEVLRSETLAYALQLPTRGGYDVTEFFGEMQVPVLADSVLGESLVVKAAARYSDYSLDGVGGVTTWNTGAIYRPVEWLKLRGEYQKAIRAPNVRELFQGTQSLFVNYEDPCSDRSDPADRTPSLDQVCLDTGVPQGALYTNLQPGSPEIRALSGGNPSLQEESTDTFTVGFSIEPALLEGLSFSADYYKIEIENAIAFFGGGAVNTATLCYDTFRDASSIYCNAVVRDPTTGVFLAVQGDYANVSVFETSGIDLASSWVRDLGFGFRGNDSTLAVTLRGTHVLDKTIQSEVVADILECEGLFGARCGEPTPEWKLNTSFNWVSGPLDVNLQWRWLSSVSWDGQYTFANEFVGRGQSYTPSDRLGAEIDSRSFYDLVGRWTFENGIEAILGIENLLDKDPPIVGSALDENNNTWPATYDPFGRKFFLSVRVGFQ